MYDNITGNACIHSKGGEMGHITLIEKLSDNDFKVRVDESGTVCHALFNCFSGRVYADDLYGVIE